MKKLKLKEGITLIALVITIIVLLILAGVSISTVVGDNSILKKAQNSKEVTEIEIEKEQVNLSYETLNAEVLVEKDEDGRVSAEELETEMNNTYGDETVKVSEDIEKGTLTITYTKSRRQYTIDNKSDLVETDENNLEKLSVGDYISNYPVEYTNVATSYDDKGIENGYIPMDNFTGWRVLSKETDEEGNVLNVKLISAGVPLSYKHPREEGTISIEKLTTGFLTTEINSTNVEDYKFYKCGFINVTGATLTETFKNDFTDKVQALTKGDIDLIKNSGDLESNAKYNNLFAVPCKDYESTKYAKTWLGSAQKGCSLAFIYNGYTHNDGIYYYNDQYILGVRPVVTLKSSVKFIQLPESENINDTPVWKISL